MGAGENLNASVPWDCELSAAQVHVCLAFLSVANSLPKQLSSFMLPSAVSESFRSSLFLPIPGYFCSITDPVKT